MTRRLQIQEFDEYKKELNRINQSCLNENGSSDQKKRVSAEQQGQWQDVIKESLKFLKDYGFCYFYTLITQQNRREGQRKKQRRILNILIRILKVLVKNQQLKNKHQANLILILKTMLFYNQRTKTFLQSIRQDSQLKQIQQILGDLISSFKQDKQQNNDSSSSLLSSRDQSFFTLINLILTSKYKIQKQSSDSTKKKSFLQAAYQLLKFYPKNIFEEIFINRCKKILEEFISQKQSSTALAYCCALCFKQQSKFIKQESKNHEHKNYHWPITLEKILKHVRKTIVGFLNLDGGIIYIGMKQNEDNVQSVGIYLSDQETVQFLKWLHDQCQFIYPKLEDDIKKKGQKIYQQSLQNLRNRQEEKSYEYHVNNYVSVQFLSFIDPNTDLDIYDYEDPEKPKKLYLIKIKIKPGTKAETFHLLKEQKNGEIQCFQRDDTSVKKLSLKEFFLFRNERNEAFMQQTVQDPQIQWNQCPQCHFKQYKSQC